VHAVQSASAELRALREERDLLYLDLVQVTSERDAAKRAVDVLRPAVLAAKDRVAAHFEEWGPPPTALGPAASAPLYAALDAATSALAPHAKALADAERIRKAILARLKEINMELEA
jgi:mevalonate pyrophosphate decarboxylase